YSGSSPFDCALRGPFGKLHLGPALTHPDSLCAHEYFDLRINGLKYFVLCILPPDNRGCQEIFEYFFVAVQFMALPQ
ncbi:MAG TPA: hypothetical protein H9713_10770, partial [Candidatus Mediterraneibacter surreyensis]|nr:hypothetical protein [Candidatus Mediterraneibacter surreyensis]